MPLWTGRGVGPDGKVMKRGRILLGWCRDMKARIVLDTTGGADADALAEVILHFVVSDRSNKCQ